MAVVAGVDAGKASLDVSVSEGPVLRFDNTAKGITKLLRHLAKQEATLAVCEPTGGYEHLLVSRLRKADLGVRAANPSRVRAFARPADTKTRPTRWMLRCCPAMDRCSLNRRRRGLSRNAKGCRNC